MRVGARRGARSMPTSSSSSPARDERVALVDALVRVHRVDELVADAHHRVERVHRALEDHRDVAPAEAAQLLGARARGGPRRGRGCCRRRRAPAGAGSAASRSRSCVLPQPDSPARPRISPAPIVRSTPSTARTRRVLDVVAQLEERLAASSSRALVGDAVTPPPSARAALAADCRAATAVASSRRAGAGC